MTHTAEGGGTTLRGRFSTGLWRELREPRDPFFDDAAASGELLVAQIRLALLLLILVIQLFPGWDPRVHAVGLAFNLVALGWAAVIWVVVRRRYRPGIGFASSAVDVSLVTFGLLGYVFAGVPEVAVNSRVLFEAYFLAIGFTSLRYDWRVCALTGLLAVGQYAVIVAYAAAGADFGASDYPPELAFHWNLHAARLVLLAAASILSMAIVLRAQRLRRLSTTDRLTGLHNRGVFDERLTEEGSRAERYRHPLTVALLDIDHFKRFNDRFGHAGGDEALRAVAEVLQRSVRRNDVVARYGGEEFALILPETEAEKALSKMEALREAVANEPMVLPGRRLSRLTVSIGVASWPADGDRVAAVLSRADARLYEAKRGGRNRVVGPEPLASAAASAS